jgi:hypothetical protein
MGLLGTSQFHFIVSKLEVCHEPMSILIIKWERKGGELHGLVVLLLIINRKINFCYSRVLFPSFDLDLSQSLQFFF